MQDLISQYQNQLQNAYKQTFATFASNDPNKENICLPQPYLDFKQPNKPQFEIPFNFSNESPSTAFTNKISSHESKKLNLGSKKFEQTQPASEGFDQALLEQMMSLQFKQLSDILQIKIGQPPQPPLDPFKMFCFDQQQENVMISEFMLENQWNLLDQAEVQVYEQNYDREMKQYLIEYHKYEFKKENILRDYVQNESNFKKMKVSTPFQLYKKEHLKRRESTHESDFKAYNLWIKLQWKRLSKDEKFIFWKKSKLEEQKIYLEHNLKEIDLIIEDLMAQTKEN